MAPKKAKTTTKKEEKPAKKVAIEYRNFCFTEYDLSDESLKNYQEFYEINCNYMIMCEKICPTTQKKHWQGYAEMKNKQMTLKTLKKKLNNEVHIEMRMSTGKNAAGYCWKGDRPKNEKKEEKFYEQYFEVPHDSVKLIIDKGK